MRYVNLTPHAITVTGEQTFQPSGVVARVSQKIGEFDDYLIAEQSFGEIVDLPEPKKGTFYIVSAMVLAASKELGRTDIVAPATGHKDCIRNEKGQIISVPGFVR